MKSVVATMYQVFDQKKPTLAPIDLLEILDECIWIMSQKAVERSVVLGKIFPDKSVKALVNKGDLIQVLCTIIENAIVVSPAHGRVLLECKTDSTYICFFVTDEGPGIPDDIGLRVFEPYYSTKSNVRDKVNLGLGLALSQNLIEGMRGSIVFSTIPDQGTTFKIILPRVTTLRQSEKP